MSGQIRITKAIKDLESIKKVQEDQSLTPYNEGLYNGIELSLALLTNRVPKFLRKRLDDITTREDIQEKFIGRTP
jgi:hypothetical protein